MVGDGGVRWQKGPISHVAAKSVMRFCFSVLFEEYGPPVTRPWTAVGSYCVRRPQNSVLRTLGRLEFLCFVGVDDVLRRFETF